MLFHGKTPTVESCCNYWSKYFPVNLHHYTKEQLIPLIKLLLFTKSKFAAIFLDILYRFSLIEAFHSFVMNRNSLYFLYLHFFSSCKHNSASLLSTQKSFNFVSNIFLVTLHVGGIRKETCPSTSLKSN